MNFLCIKWGDKYSPDYVNNLYKMVKKNYSKSFTFTCYTDDPEGLICDTAPIPDDGLLHPKYWFGKEDYCWDRAKFLVFNSHEWLGYTGKWCYFDLDVIIQNNIDDIDILAQKPRIVDSLWQPKHQIHDRFFIDIRGTYFNSSMMMWPGAACEHIYRDVLQNNQIVFKTFFKGSDNYHYWRQRKFWKNIPHDWVYSYNRGMRHPTDLEKFKYRKDAKICIFNTDHVPHPDAKKQIKIEDLTDEVLLLLWEGE